MKVLYYPYLTLETTSLNKVASCFEEVFVLSPLALRPRFVIPKVKFIEPLPSEWSKKFRSLISQYQIFKQVYTDKSFLEYLKHVPPAQPDFEAMTSLMRFLRGNQVDKPEESFPPEVTCALFLHLARQYSQDIKAIYQSIRLVKQQEENLKQILDSPLETDNTSLLEIKKNLLEINLDYVHPDEDIWPFMDKVLFAFSILLKKAGLDLKMAFTEDEVVHEYLKMRLQKLPYKIFSLILPYPCDNLNYFWNSLLEIYCDGRDYTAVSELLTPYLHNNQGINNSGNISLEIIFVPRHPASDVLKGNLETKETNGIFCLWKGEGYAHKN